MLNDRSGDKGNGMVIEDGCRDEWVGGMGGGPGDTEKEGWKIGEVVV